jgi:hypothetical protein
VRQKLKGVPKFHDGEDYNTDGSGPVNFHGLAGLVKSREGLLAVVKHYFLPQSLDSRLRPTDDWLQRLCDSKELFSFTHKKQALEDIKEKIDNEIGNKKLGLEIWLNMANIDSHVHQLGF